MIERFPDLMNDLAIIDHRDSLEVFAAAFYAPLMVGESILSIALPHLPAQQLHKPPFRPA